jgi:hypothetical protein
MGSAARRRLTSTTTEGDLDEFHQDRHSRCRHIGSQVAWQMAFHGKHVIVYDAIPEGLQKGKSLHREYAEHFIDQRGAVQKQIDDTFARLTVRRTDLHGLLLQAVRGVASVETRFGCVVVSADRSGVVRITCAAENGPEFGLDELRADVIWPRRSLDDGPPRDAPAHSSGPGQKPSMPTKGT